MLKKALKDGLITKKQYDKLPPKMLEGLVKKGGNAGLKKSRVKPLTKGKASKKNKKK